MQTYVGEMGENGGRRHRKAIYRLSNEVKNKKKRGWEKFPAPIFLL